MTTSEPANAAVVLVNVFNVEPARQTELAETVLATAREVAARLPGFVDATVLASTDGTRVVNYARWEDRDAFERFLAAARAEIARAVALGTPDGHQYTVVGRATRNVAE